jgi:DNA-directed RNA polymerase subunit beta
MVFFSKQKKMQKTLKYVLQKYQRSNQDTLIFQHPFVHEGEWIQSGDILADCSTSLGGELCLGKNIFIAYMPWEGYNYEDAILISQRLVTEDVYTSIHIESYEAETRSTKLGKEQITKKIPEVSEGQLSHLDERGIIKRGTSVKEGDILVGKVTPVQKKFLSAYEKLLYTILEKELIPMRDSSLRTPKGLKAKVLEVKILNFFTEKNQKEPSLFRYSQSKTILPTFFPEGTGESGPPFFCKTDKTGKKVFSFPKSGWSLKNGGSFSRALKFDGGEQVDSLVKEKQKNFSFFLPSFSLQKQVNSKIFFSFPFHHVIGARLGKVQPSSNSLCSPLPFPNRQGVAFSNGEVWGQRPAIHERGGYSKKKQALFDSFNEVVNLQKNVFSTSTQNFVNHKSKKNTKKKIPFFKSNFETQLQYNFQRPEKVQVYLVEKRKIQVGDKMSGRHGNKGIVSQILPITDMPFLPDGTPLDMVLNPLGVPSRMNVGQIYECILGLASKYLQQYYRIQPFDEIYGPQASRSFTFSKLYEARKKTGQKWLFNPCYPGKIQIFDGQTGEPYENPVTVGISYILKLVHLVDDKIHARSTGPYSLVTQQPLKGRSKYGGQRLGEMEVWAIEAYGAAFVLLEMLTIKSDDISGRMTLWSNILLNMPIYIGTPESFKVLVCELQALCLDMGLFRLNKKGFLTQIEHLMQLP